MITQGFLANEISDPNFWRPTGTCEGVFYLLEKSVQAVENGILVQKLVYPSTERIALSYLRPANETWKKLHPGSIGVCKPDVEFLAPSKLREQAAMRECGISWLFVADNPNCISANNESVVHMWKFQEVHEGVFAVELGDN
jgi:hypothetical protein